MKLKRLFHGTSTKDENFKIGITYNILGREWTDSPGYALRNAFSTTFRLGGGMFVVAMTQLHVENFLHVQDVLETHRGTIGLYQAVPGRSQIISGSASLEQRSIAPFTDSGLDSFIILYCRKSEIIYEQECLDHYKRKLAQQRA
jgi:hypothetical protein